MPMTMIENILARSAGVDGVQAGDIVTVDVDQVIQLDLGFVTQIDPLPKQLAHPERVSVILDHGAPAPSVEDAAGHQRARQYVKDVGPARFFDIGQHGIVHQVLLEEGIALPGQVLACTDSHTCASGAVNCAARGLGGLEILQILCTGTTWFKVQPTIRYDFLGEHQAGVFGKDVFLAIADWYGDHAGHNIEFGGPSLKSLTLDDRATIATMCAEINAEFATFPADELVMDFLDERAVAPFTPAVADPGAQYAHQRSIDLASLVPYVAKPDFVPNNTVPVTDLSPVKIDQAFLGSCANGKLEDLRVAASIVEGHRVAAGVRFVVTPASQKVYLEAVRRGYVEALAAAGALVTNSTCGACLGYHMGVLAPGEVCITSSTRNFKGRMGSSEAKVYIGSSATVAASALAGEIVDPRPFMSR